MPTLFPLRLPRLGDDRLAALAAAGDERAFEALYDRHHRGLLGFCRHMLRSPEEAEDALQQTYLRAHRALVERGAPAELRPWLYTIARNCCLTMLSARRPVADDEPELASLDGLGEQVQVRADLRAVVADVERLPDDQRAALVLAELADLSHDQIAEVIGVRPGKVKALIHQARTTLIAERAARETPCESIREQLSTARGGALRRGPLRRHLRLCASCRAYREAVGQQRRALALALPVTPSLGLKAAVLGGASAAGGAGAATVGGVTGGVATKLAVGALVIGGGAGGGAAIVHRAAPAPRPAAATVRTAAARPPGTALVRLRATPRVGANPVPVRRRARSVAHRRVRPQRTAKPAIAAAPAPLGSPARVKAPTAGRPVKVKAPNPVKAKNVKPVKVKSPKPAKLAKPPKPAKHAKPPKPAKHAKPPKPATAPKPPKPAKPAETPKPAKTAKPAKTPKPANPAKPAKTP